MSNVIVYVLLLDNLTGFRNCLNETLIKRTQATHSDFSPLIESCESGATKEILNAVSSELNIGVKSLINSDEISDVINEVITHNQNTKLYQPGFVTVPPYVPETEAPDKLYDKAVDLFDFDYEYDHPQRNVIPEDKVNTISVTERVNNVTQTEASVKNPPFLVAIFETVSNVTAQTCAGTLITPRWVLTAANCVNILINISTNITNTPDRQTLYTVVAGAHDPLYDGSAHNVTTVVQDHGPSINSSKNHKTVSVAIGPYLAMMKIEPEFVGVGLPLVEQNIKMGNVVVHGWVLSQNHSGLAAMKLVTISARILSTAECQAMYSFNNNEVICLFANAKENITQINSGGPVLISQDGQMKMLAVAQTDERVMIAYPLYMHLDWIKNVLNNKL